MKLAAVILAAGESRRMGRAKALLPFRGGTFLSTLAETLGEFCSPVIAVFGFDAEKVAALAPAGVVPTINENYKLGMLTSLQTGLRALGDAESRVLFTLVDHPAVRRATIADVVAANSEIAIPRRNGRRGHPVVMSAGIAMEFLREPVTSKTHDVIDRHVDAIQYVETDDPGISDDVDDPALYEALLAREGDSH